MREAGAEHIEKLAPAAVRALLRAWERGNPTGALEVLRALGFLRPAPADAVGEIRFTLDIGAGAGRGEELDGTVLDAIPPYTVISPYEEASANYE